MWAEAIGMGEMGLSEDAFWSLTPPVFAIKYAAFKRSEDRRTSLMLELALRTGHVPKEKQSQAWQEIYTRRRYPIKAWLNPQSELNPDGTD